MPRPTVCKRHKGGKRKAAGATKHSKSKVAVPRITPQIANRKPTIKKQRVEKPALGMGSKKKGSKNSMANHFSLPWWN